MRTVLGWVLVAGLTAAAAAQKSAAPVVHVAFPTGAESALGAQISALLADPAVARAHWGIAVTELDGTPIYGFREGELYRPASNTKLFTTAAAMALLGPESTVQTSVELIRSKGGKVANQVVLRGMGDPGLSGQDFPYRTPAELKAAGLPVPVAGSVDGLRILDGFADETVKRGVKRVEGDVVGVDRIWVWEPYPIAWDIGDMLTGDGAPVSALTINDNLLNLTVTPGTKVGDAATASVVPDIGYYQFDVKVKTVAAGAQASLQVERAPGAKVVRIYGTIAMDKPYKTEIAIMDPAEFAAMALKKKLEEHGIKVTGVARAEHFLPIDGEGFYRESHEPVDFAIRASNVVASTTPSGAITPTGPCIDCGTPGGLTHTSPTLAEDVKETLKISQNLHAELMMRRLGGKFGDPMKNTTAQGARVVRQFLVSAGLDGDDFLFYDGSGMSSHDLVAPRATVKLLAYAATQPWFAAWKAALPVGGVDGSLTSRFTDAPLKGHVFAKTGTLGESRALAGYLDCASGKQVVFSIMVDNHTPGSSADRAVMDKIVAAIAAAE